MFKKALIPMGVVIVFIGVCFGIYKYIGDEWTGEQRFGQVTSTSGVVTSSDFRYYASDVVGTHIGTSTTGVVFNNDAATSSYVSKIGGNINTAVYTIKMLAAGTTSTLGLSVQGSNDFFCDTTDVAVTGTINKTDINWYSAGDHLINKVGTTALVSASSTNPISWTNAVAGAGQEILLTNLNYECLRLNVSGVSTTVYIGLRTK